jgi:hypothetical protein
MRTFVVIAVLSLLISGNAAAFGKKTVEPPVLNGKECRVDSFGSFRDIRCRTTSPKLGDISCSLLVIEDGSFEITQEFDEVTKEGDYTIRDFVQRSKHFTFDELKGEDRDEEAIMKRWCVEEDAEKFDNTRWVGWRVHRLNQPAKNLYCDTMVSGFGGRYRAGTFHSTAAVFHKGEGSPLNHITYTCYETDRMAMAFQGSKCSCRGEATFMPVCGAPLEFDLGKTLIPKGDFQSLNLKKDEFTIEEFFEEASHWAKVHCK